MIRDIIYANARQKIFDIMQSKYPELNKTTEVDSNYVGDLFWPIYEMHMYLMSRGEFSRCLWQLSLLASSAAPAMKY